MRVALMIEGQEGVAWEQWLALAHAAEEANLDGLFRSDHYRSIVRGDPAGSLDAWATLAGLAAVTTKLRLGTMVSPVTFRRVPVLAKLVTTVDHISNGRVELGIGAGWFESEHEAYGFAFPPTKERLDELDRQLEELTRQWTDAPDIWPKPRPAAAPADHRRRHREAAHRPRCRAVRRRVQHRLRVGRRSARAQAPPRRGRARGGTRPPPLLADDRLRRRPR
jgi:alkanesulfonate monooxygenase SsuD/methylene tetrahydromethanopterin reductase-like flavin-dependent oxidoreductase (luciferase family)